MFWSIVTDQGICKKVILDSKCSCFNWTEVSFWEFNIWCFFKIDVSRSLSPMSWDVLRKCYPCISWQTQELPLFPSETKVTFYTGFPILVLGHLGCFSAMSGAASWSLLTYVFRCIWSLVERSCDARSITFCLGSDPGRGVRLLPPLCCCIRRVGVQMVCISEGYCEDEINQGGPLKCLVQGQAQ